MPRRPSRSAAVATGLTLALALGAVTAQFGQAADDPRSLVGRQSDGSVLLPTGQRIAPAGLQTEFSGRPNEIALRPGGGVAAVLIASDGTQLRTLDTRTGALLSASSGLAEDASYAGLLWSGDGRTLYASGAGGDLAVVSVDAVGRLGATRKITLPKQRTDTNASLTTYPGGLGLSADGATLYVALSRDNALGVVDVASGTLTGLIPVGNAPHSVIVSGSTAYVSNEGGRPATATDTTNLSAGTRIVSDPYGGGSTTGTVSVVDLTTRTERSTIAVGLHPTAMALSGETLWVANTNSDTVSAIDTRTAAVADTITLTPYAGAPVGVGPTGLTPLPDNRLAVSLGMANAVAIVDLGTRQLTGLVPTGWYPSGTVYDPTTDRLVTANLHGVGTTADADAGRSVRGLSEVGSVSLVTPPNPEQLRAMTSTVHSLNRWQAGDPKIGSTTAIPSRLGDPSPIKHVIYVIKENRTYDQLLGDLGRGNGDPRLAEFGKHVAPNTQALATQFPLMDNFYNSGRRSNDGHNWAMQAGAPDYLEKGVSTKRTSVFGPGRGTPPSSGFDALLYRKSGFLWENALTHGKTFDNYGEYTAETISPPATSDIPSLQPHIIPEYSGYELTLPDIARARIFKNHLATYEARGAMPDLIHLTLPNDHTGGSNPRYNTPASQVADNDQGLGSIVDAVSHSSFWASTAIFVEEDDTQGGPDHVEGHRGPLLVISPYAKHGGYIDSTMYTQVDVVKTIEQILGLPPMNTLDASAKVMRSAFTDTPDLSTYTVRSPDVLALGPIPNPALATLTGLPLLWATAAMAYDTKHLDAVNPALLNRDIWYSTHHFAVPYPGDSTILTPAQVTRRFPDLQRDD